MLRFAADVKQIQRGSTGARGTAPSATFLLARFLPACTVDVRTDMTGQRRRPVTLSEVAALAGVSVATASKAINGRATVAAATRNRVLAAAHKLSFQSNGPA